MKGSERFPFYVHTAEKEIADMKIKKRALTFLLALLMVVSAVPFGAFGAFAVDGAGHTPDAPDDGVISETEKENYLSLYSQEGLLFFWSGIDLTGEEGKINDLQNLVEGSPVSSIPFAGIARKGRLDSDKIFSLGELLPYHIVNDPTVGNVKVLDDMTLEVSLLQQDHWVPDGAHGVQAELKFGPLLYLSLSSRNWNTQTALDWGVTPYEAAESAARLNRPVNESFGFVAGTSGYAAPLQGTDSVYIATDYYNTQTKVFGNTRGEQYTIGVLFDYNIKPDKYTGEYKLSFYRDTKLGIDAEDTGVRKAEFKLKYDARYRGNFVSGSTPQPANNDLEFGGQPFSYESIRLYDHVLTEEELQKNHFADIVCHYRPNMSDYNLLDAEQKLEIQEYYADKKTKDITKEDLETVFMRYATTGGNVDFREIEAYVKYAGLQTRLEDYAAFRLCYDLDMEEIALLESQGTQVSVGLMYSDVKTPDEMTVVFNNSIGEFKAPEDIGHTLIYRGGEWGAGLDCVINEGAHTKVGIKFSELSLEDLANNPSKDKEYYFRLYVAIDRSGGSVINYLDFNDVLFGDSVSLTKVSEHFLCNGFADSSVLAAAATEEMKLAAKAGEPGFLKGDLVQRESAEILSYILGAYKNVADSLTDYLALSKKITEGMSYDEVISLVGEYADARAYLLNYATIGQTEYESIQTLLAELMEINEARRETIRATLAASTSLEQDAIDDLVERVVLNHELNTNKIKEALSAGTRPFINAEHEVADSEKEHILVDALKVKGNITLNGTPLREYTIVTDEEHMTAAKQLQKVLSAHYGVLIGVLSVDSPLIKDSIERNGLTAIHIGLTDKHLSKGTEELYSIYGVDDSMYIEGTTPEAVAAGVTAFLAANCIRGGEIDVVLNEGSYMLSNQPYVPMFTTNMQTEFPKVNVSNYEASGVWEGFMQTMSEKPEEVTVLERILPENFALSMKLQVFVSPNGHDQLGDGSINNPYETINRALEDVEFRHGGVIWLREGTYSSAELRAAHSGSMTAPLFISAYGDEKVTVVGGKSIAPSEFVAVDQADFVLAEDAALFNKFKAGNSANIYACDLIEAGFTAEDFAKYTSYDSMPPLAVGDTAYHLARFPNLGETDSDRQITNGRVPSYNTAPGAKTVKKVGKITDDNDERYEEHMYEVGSWEIWIGGTVYEDRILQYANKLDNLHIYGSVTMEFAQEIYSVKLLQDAESGDWYMADKAPDTYSGARVHNNSLYFFNMPEDLDAPNEFLIDLDKMVLYIYGKPTEDVSIAVGQEKLLAVDGSSNVIINGIDFKHTSYDIGVELKDATRVFVQGGDFFNMSGLGLRIRDCYMSGALYNTFADMKSGLKTEFDTWSTNVTCNIIQNNVFGSKGSPQGRAAGLLLYGGFGDVASHNKMIDVGVSVAYQLDLVFEYNEIIGGPQYGRDSGPLYAVGTGNCGMHIRYNYMHDLNYSLYGIYLDVMTFDNYVYGNVVHYEEGQNARCINIHSSAYTVVYNNVTINGGKEGAIVNQPTFAYCRVNGVETGIDVDGYIWPSAAREYFIAPYKCMDLDVIASRYPFSTYMMHNTEEALLVKEMNEHWSALDKYTPMENAEVIARSPGYDVYKNNVMYATTRTNGINTAQYWDDTCIFENNISYNSNDNLGFVDEANGNYTLKEDSIVFRDIPDFIPLHPERAGLTH